ncbi:MAG: IPT/TIG domain-containing protein [Planctomycetes bacterium]|nr:IPT/TIG domain-containing protein [Planctomycetota bacterium]
MDGQTDVNFLALYLDNGNGSFDGPGTDTLATATAGTSFNAANGTYTATLTGAAAAFAMNQGKRFFLVAKLAGQASPAETLRVAVTSLTQSSPTGGTVSGTPTAASSALVIDVATLTVNAGPTNPTIVAREQNAAGFTVMVGQFRLSASNANFTVAGFTLSTSGNGNWAANLDAATGVQVWRDDGDGSFNATDTQLFAGAGATPSVSCVFGSNLTINMNTNEDLWVVLNVLASAGASPSETFSSQIAAPADVNSLTGGGQVLFGTAAPTAATLKVITYAFTSFTPVTSLPAGGGAITITGSGFALPVTVTIGGVNCGGGAVVNAAGTQITGLTVPAGAGQNLAIVLTTNNLAAKTLSQTFSYSNVVVIGGGGGGRGGGGGGGCAATAAAAPAAMLLPLCIALYRRRKEKRS